MTLFSRYWDELTWQDIQALDPLSTVAVLPVSATEQHGPHLPLSVDAEINRGILRRALDMTAPDLPVLALPAVVYGFSEEHRSFPGTLSLDAETLHRLWFEIGTSVHRAGLRKLVLFNSHGGQVQIAEIVARELRIRFGMLVVTANSFGWGEPAGLFPDAERRHGIHGGASETSQMLHLRPDLARRDSFQDFPSSAADVERQYDVLRLEGQVSTGWMTQDLNPLGACGDVRLASAEAGQAIVEHAAARLAKLFAELSAFPLDSLKAGPLDGHGTDA